MTTETSYLTLKQVNGDSHRIEIDVASATVLDLKLAVQAKLNYPPESQRLIFQGRVMEDTNSLTFYSLTSGLTVHLAVNTKLVPSTPVASLPSPVSSAAVHAPSPPSAPTTNLVQLLPLLRAHPAGPAAIATLKKMAENILANPTEQKYMKIRLTNEALKRKLLDVPYGLQCVTAMGFTAGVEEGHLVVVPTAANWDLVVASKRILDQFDAVPSSSFSAPAVGTNHPLGGMSPESLLAMMDNPMFAQMVASNPQLQQMAQNNPMLQQALQNPALLRQSLQAVQSDPYMRQQMQQMMANPQQMQQMMTASSNPMFGHNAPLGGAPPSPFAAPVSLHQPPAASAPAAAAPVASPTAPTNPRSEEDEIAEAIARSLREM
ncbi:hypothetical protein DYB25_004712 [Aphanomyces astaci]|uniref:Ubiquitin-like domain-containing protein n=1 Tax=Aphanomyces astaci TaxID=112090 RepID=A0A397AU59_APHAT|nr:hypothetical protein DYB25_004712 [Aphanomyces astaci]RHY65468.1 hypothetical protein DYB34_000305 [Aphanomyces astaci]RHZ01087.1 hypothetical protein DYB26_003780 [Aphanomyces astaci]